MASIHHLKKFIPILAQLCSRLCPLLSTANKYHFTWESAHEKAFKNILDTVHNITENRHFVSDRETRVVSDASTDNLG